MDLRGWSKGFCVSVALAVAGCGASPRETPLDMTTVKNDLDIVAHARVLFAH